MSQYSKNEKVRVVDSLWTFAVAVAFVGPLALPLLWRNPRFSGRTKLVATVAVIVLTVALLWYGGSSLKTSWDQIQEIRRMMEQAR